MNDSIDNNKHEDGCLPDVSVKTGIEIEMNMKDEDNSRRGCFGCEHHIPDFLNKKVDEPLQTICGIVDSVDRPTNLTDWKATILLCWVFRLSALKASISS